MKYGKLITILTRIVDSGSDANPDVVIAYHLLDQLESDGCPGIRDVARACSVSVAAVSRFCRGIGIEDYGELRELIVDAQARRAHHLAEAKGYSIKDFETLLCKTLHEVAQSVDRDGIRKFCDAIDKSRRIAAFGYLKSQSAAQSFQNQMLFCGKVVHTKNSFSLQREYIENARDDDLILIFSHAGIYFDYMQPLQLKHRPTIAMVTGAKVDWRYAQIGIPYRSTLAQETLLYELNFVSSLLFETYWSAKRRRGFSESENPAR